MVRIVAFLVLIILLGVQPARPGQIEYPQVIHTQYEAVDQKTGGHFVLWSEREKIFYGLDQKLFPGARYVDITQVTPSVGSITLTYVEVRTVGSTTSDYLYLAGNVRFRVSGMTLKSSNFCRRRDDTERAVIGHLAWRRQRPSAKNRKTTPCTVADISEINYLRLFRNSD